MLRAPRPGAAAGASFVYDARNQLIEGAGVSYVYGVLSERTGLRTPENTSAQFVTDPSGALDRVLVKTAAGFTSSVQTYYVYGLGLVGEEAGGVYRAYHFDARGSTVALTDIEGATIDTFLYGPYGESVKHDGRSTTPFQFNGQYGVQTDSNGLLYMRARYYDPAIKRFINQDTRFGELTPGISLNRFAFANGNPVDGIDPFGLNSITINVQSFISARSLPAPSLDLIKGGTIPFFGSSLGYGFYPTGTQAIGDDRGFLMSPAQTATYGSYRTTQTLILDPADLAAHITMSDDTGISTVVFPNGTETTGKAATNAFFYMVYRNPGYVDVIIKGSASDPLFLVAPSLAYELALTIDPSNNNITAAFDHTMFPSFQVFLNGVPAFNYWEQGDVLNLFAWTSDTFSTQNGTVAKVPVPYIVLSPSTYTSWIGYVPEGSSFTQLLYEGGNGVAIMDPGFAYPGQITFTPTSTPFVSGPVSTVPIAVGGIQVGSMPGTGFYAQVQQHSFQIVSDVYVGNVNPSEPNQGYIVRTEYPVAIVDYSYSTGGGQVILLDSTQMAAYAANGWKTDPLLGGGPQDWEPGTFHGSVA